MTLKILLFDSEALTILRSCEYLPTLLIAASFESDCALIAASACRFYGQFILSEFCGKLNSAYTIVVLGHRLKRTFAKLVLVCTVTDSVLICLMVFVRR